MDGVVFVFENRRMVLQTTLSWDFNWNVLPHYSIMGLPLSAERNLQYESDIIIGMFDTGNCINRSSRTLYVGTTMNFDQ